jgi:thiosulfate/3-mercaptopyruvate sulfurtransferase
MISSEELLEIYQLEDVLVLDSRWYLDGRKGIDSYRKGHIPGAIFVDVETVCTGSGGPSRGRHPLKSPKDFVAALASIGVGSGIRIVC